MTFSAVQSDIFSAAGIHQGHPDYATATRAVKAALNVMVKSGAERAARMQPLRFQRAVKTEMVAQFGEVIIGSMISALLSMLLPYVIKWLIEKLQNFKATPRSDGVTFDELLIECARTA